MKKSEPEFIVFTDGSSRGNPGRGGWGAVIVQSEKLKVQNGGAIVTELGGREDKTTNNRMELMAAIQGLKKTRKEAEIKLYTDSQYVINGITKWVHGWKRNGWKTKAKEDVLNRDLWEQLEELASERNITFTYVGGHVGIVGNERCDHIATDLADGNKIKLYHGPLGGYDLPNILDLADDATLSKAKESNSSHSKAKAYSYVSMVGGVIEVHHSWPECEKRVKGTKGARYKKALSAADERKIIAEFEAI